MLGKKLWDPQETGKNEEFDEVADSCQEIQRKNYGLLEENWEKLEKQESTEKFVRSETSENGPFVEEPISGKFSTRSRAKFKTVLF
jgi:hypothetical protein